VHPIQVCQDRLGEVKKGTHTVTVQVEPNGEAGAKMACSLFQQSLIVALHVGASLNESSKSSDCARAEGEMATVARAGTGTRGKIVRNHEESPSDLSLSGGFKAEHAGVVGS
jgi:hypothetical protein